MFFGSSSLFFIIKVHIHQNQNTNMLLRSGSVTHAPSNNEDDDPDPGRDPELGRHAQSDSEDDDSDAQSDSEDDDPDAQSDSEDDASDPGRFKAMYEALATKLVAKGAKHQAMVAALKAKVAKHRAEVAQLQTTAAAKDALIAQLRQQREDLMQDVDAFKGKLEEARRLSRVHQQIVMCYRYRQKTDEDKGPSKLFMTSLKLHQAEKRATKLQENNLVLQAENKALKAERDKLQEDKVTLKADNKALRAKLDKIKDEQNSEKNKGGKDEENTKENGDKDEHGTKGKVGRIEQDTKGKGAGKDEQGAKGKGGKNEQDTKAKGDVGNTKGKGVAEEQDAKGKGTADEQDSKEKGGMEPAQSQGFMPQAQSHEVAAPPQQSNLATTKAPGNALKRPPNVGQRACDFRYMFGQGTVQWTVPNKNGNGYHVEEVEIFHVENTVANGKLVLGKQKHQKTPVRMEQLTWVDQAGKVRFHVTLHSDQSRYFWNTTFNFFKFATWDWDDATKRAHARNGGVTQGRSFAQVAAPKPPAPIGKPSGQDANVAPAANAVTTPVGMPGLTVEVMKMMMQFLTSAMEHAATTQSPSGGLTPVTTPAGAPAHGEA